MAKLGVVLSMYARGSRVTPVPAPPETVPTLPYWEQETTPSLPDDDGEDDDKTPTYHRASGVFLTAKGAGARAALAEALETSERVLARGRGR